MSALRELYGTTLGFPLRTEVVETYLWFLRLQAKRGALMAEVRNTCASTTWSSGDAVGANVFDRFLRMQPDHCVHTDEHIQCD